MKTIAEVGVNHNGDMDLAIELIRKSAASGADTVKFQTFKTEQLVTRTAQQAGYQHRNFEQDKPDTQFGMLKALELGFDDFRTLKDECHRQNIQFLSTPFDIESAHFLTDALGDKVIKVGSGDFDNYPLLIAIASRGVEVILSTGMATLGEIEMSLGALAFGYLAGARETPSIEAFWAAFGTAEARDVLAQKVTILHCTTEYPAPPESLNLRAIPLIARAFGVPVGFSDHSQGDAAAIAALTLGATVLEKHVTLDRSLPGPDHKASMEPDEFARMVTKLKATKTALGDGIKRVQQAEIANKKIARKSPVAARAIRAGDVITEEDITLKRTVGGGPAADYYRFLGQPATRDYEADDVIL